MKVKFFERNATRVVLKECGIDVANELMAIEERGCSLPHSYMMSVMSSLESKNDPMFGLFITSQPEYFHDIKDCFIFYLCCLGRWGI